MERNFKLVVNDSNQETHNQFIKYIQTTKTVKMLCKFAGIISSRIK